MSLREQFEEWVENTDAYKDGMRLTGCEKQLMFEAYQAGHAASGRDELLEALEGVCKSIECYEAEQRDFSPNDEYDDMMFPKWETALELINRLKGQQ